MIHQDNYDDIFSEFGTKEFVIEKIANISKLDDGYVLLGENQSQKKTTVQLYSSKNNIVEDYIPQSGKPVKVINKPKSPFFEALSPDNIIVEKEEKKSRDRFDTNEHMELLGEGKFGQGNTPVISKEKLKDEDVV